MVEKRVTTFTKDIDDLDDDKTNKQTLEESPYMVPDHLTNVVKEPHLDFRDGGFELRRVNEKEGTMSQTSVDGDAIYDVIDKYDVMDKESVHSVATGVSSLPSHVTTYGGDDRSSELEIVQFHCSEKICNQF